MWLRSRWPLQGCSIRCGEHYSWLFLIWWSSATRRPQNFVPDVEIKRVQLRRWWAEGLVFIEGNRDGGDFQNPLSPTLDLGLPNVIRSGAGEDMVQEVMTRLWQMDNLNHVRTNLGGYLHRSSLISVSTRSRNESDGLSMKIRINRIQMEERNSKDINVQMEIEQAIQLLPDRCRLVFVFSRYELLSNQEIADLMEISIKTVENQMTKALSFVRTSGPFRT